MISPNNYRKSNKRYRDLLDIVSNLFIVGVGKQNIFKARFSKLMMVAATVCRDAKRSFRNYVQKDFNQGLVKGAILCFRNPYFYFRHGESTSTASQLISPASQKSKDLNKVPFLLQDLDFII